MSTDANRPLRSKPLNERYGDITPTVSKAYDESACGQPVPRKQSSSSYEIFRALRNCRLPDLQHFAVRKKQLVVGWTKPAGDSIDIKFPIAGA